MVINEEWIIAELKPDRYTAQQGARDPTRKNSRKSCGKSIANPTAQALSIHAPIGMRSSDFPTT
ncbi:MAG: hypothetical protein ACRER2_12655 [Methylococcales bacterium]